MATAPKPPPKPAAAPPPPPAKPQTAEETKTAADAERKRVEDANAKLSAQASGSRASAPTPAPPDSGDKPLDPEEGEDPQDYKNRLALRDQDRMIELNKDVQTTADAQRKGSEEFQKAGVAKWLEEHDERPEEFKPQQVPGITETMQMTASGKPEKQPVEGAPHGDVRPNEQP